MAEHCWHGGPWHNWPAEVTRCNEPAVDGKIYCRLHFEQAMERVALVSPVIDTGLRWSNATRGHEVGQHSAWRTVPV